MLPIGLTVISMLITQSAAAVVQAAVLIAAVMLTYRRHLPRSWTVVVLVILASSPGVIAAYLNSFLLKFNADSHLRVALLSYVYEIRNGWDYVFGYGPFSLESDLWNLANPRSAEESSSVASLNDSGLLNFFVVQFGVVGLAIPFAIFLRMRKDISTVCFLGLLMSSKLPYTAPVIYFGLLPIILRLGAPLAVAATSRSSASADGTHQEHRKSPSRAHFSFSGSSQARSP
jgi:hypothetical protein